MRGFLASALQSTRRAHAGEDFGLLVLRVTAGGFLVWEVLDNVVEPRRMAEFAVFLAANGFPWPGVMAPLSVAFQLFAGSAWLLGLCTRVVSVAIALHFALAWFTVHLDEPLRGGWPALALIAMGVVLATHGAGRWSLDAWHGSWSDLAGR